MLAVLSDGEVRLRGAEMRCAGGGMVWVDVEVQVLLLLLLLQRWKKVDYVSSIELQTEFPSYAPQQTTRQPPHWTKSIEATVPLGARRSSLFSPATFDEDNVLCARKMGTCLDSSGCITRVHEPSLASAVRALDMEKLRSFAPTWWTTRSSSWPTSSATVGASGWMSVLVVDWC